MKTIIRGGILLGVLVTIWTYVFGLSGMHRNMGTAMLFPIVATVIELAVLVWALRRTAAEGRGWGGQVSAGTLLAFIGGCLIFATSIFYVSMVHPTYFAEVNAAGEAFYRSQGWDEARIQQAMAQSAPMQTPMIQGLMGLAATVITGLVLSMILGLFIRSRTPQATPVHA
jgi:hypothetical protein